MTAPAGAKLCVLVCECFEREARLVLEQLSCDDVTLTSFPTCGPTPTLPTEQLLGIVRSKHPECQRLLAIGGACLRPLKHLPNVPEHLQVDSVDQCFSMLVGKSIIDDYLGRGAYLVTPGWLQTWQERVAGWGFDQETARSFFKESAARLVLLDTGIDRQAETRLAAFAELVDLPAEIVTVGLDYFRLHLERLVLQWRLSRTESTTAEVSSKTERALAEYAMVVELLSSLAELHSESRAVDAIFDLFTMLCAPRHLAYLALSKGGPGQLQSRTDRLFDDEALLRSKLDSSPEEYGWTPSGNGFWLRLQYRHKTVGVLEIEDITFPEYREHYLNLALVIARVCGLAIGNARVYQRLAHSRAELKHRNEELDEFTFVASHDLTEPLRQLVSFSCLLRKDLGDKLPPRAETDLRFISDAAYRMQKLVQDLLQLSRIGRLSLKKKRLALDECVDDALQALAVLLEETGTEVQRDELPEVLGDRTLITQLYQNLISNAVKFVKNCKPSIHVTVEHGDGGPVLGVRDNGIGINPRDTETIFRPFRRLHGRDEYQGSGIGLSICKKAIERHGGTIWVESQPDQGAHFKFTLRDEAGERESD